MHGLLTLQATAIAVFLLSLRLAAIFAGTPLLAAAAVPSLVRVLLAMAISVAITLGLHTQSSAIDLRGPLGAGALLQAGLTELALGATLALGVHLAFAAFALAGELLGVQMGIGLAQVVDPTSSAQVPLLSSVFGQLAVVVFFIGDGHHALLRGVVFSLERFPLGRPWPIDAALAPVLEQVAGIFSLGFALAAPVVLCLLLVEVALGVVARNLPQINMIAMGIPLKVVAGLAALAVWLGGMQEVAARVYGSIFRTWEALFPAGAGVP